MKKKLLLCAGIVVMIAAIILGVWQYVEVRNRQTDPNWKLAEQIYNMENALKEVDEDYECKSIFKVTPYAYADSVGNTITYYCCQTTYISDEYQSVAQDILRKGFKCNSSPCVPARKTAIAFAIAVFQLNSALPS